MRSIRAIKDKVKSKVDCRALYKKYFPDLHKESGNYLCAWHDDTAPSLQPFKDRLYCHSEGRSYDAFDTYMKATGCEFGTAVKELAQQCGINTDRSCKKRKGTRGKISTAYTYVDEFGRLLHETVRFSDPKSFAQRRPDPDTAGEWIWNLEGIQPVLYRLPEVVLAHDVWICEGEKDADNLHALGLCGSTAPMGAGNWHEVCEGGKPPEALKDKTVYILPDNDEPGRKHALAIARNIYGHAAGVKITLLPGLPDKGDVTDFIEQHGREDATRLLLELVQAAPEYEPDADSSSQERDEPEKKSKFKRLYRLFKETGAAVFLDDHSAGWARIKIQDHTENICLSSDAFCRYLLRLYVNEYDEGIAKESIKQVAEYLEAVAEERWPLHNRFCWLEGKLYLDLCWPTWEVVEVSGEGWQIVRLDRSPFKRFSHQHPLPKPETGNQVQQILNFLPLRDEDSRLLLVVWLCLSALAHIPRPVVVLHGHQGAGKSTVAEILRLTLDPSSVLTLSVSKDHTEFIQLLDHHAILPLDNIHKLPQWASDDLCRAVTGSGFTKRMLYTNDDDKIYQFSRGLILNGINVPGTSADLLDRSILIQLERLPEEERRERNELVAAFEEARPHILGAILSAVSTAIRIKPTVKLDRLPRMADWTLWGCAVAEALGIGREKFLRAYYGSIRIQNDEVLSADPVCTCLLELMEDDLLWTGKPSDLYQKLVPIAEKQGSDNEKRWPKSAQSLSRRLNELTHNLAEAGIRVERRTEGRGERKARNITITRTANVAEIPSPAAPRPRTNTDEVLRGDDMGTQPCAVINSVPCSDPDNIAESLLGDDGDGGDASSRSFAGCSFRNGRECSDFRMGWCHQQVQKTSNMHRCPRDEVRAQSVDLGPILNDVAEKLQAYATKEVDY